MYTSVVSVSVTFSLLLQLLLVTNFLPTLVREKLVATGDIFLPKQVINKQGGKDAFNPPRRDKPKGSSGGGSRYRRPHQAKTVVTELSTISNKFVIT